MGIYRPGGLELTAYAIKAAGLKKGDKLLDIGCGDGTAAIFARDELGLDVTAIDNNLEAVEEAKANGIAAQLCSAAMLPFESRGFDAVMMECVFSVLRKQEEAIHEAYCMLKPGGKLIISDVYATKPDMDRYRKEYTEAMRLFRKPREHEDCGSYDNLPSPFCQDGAVVMEGLSGLLDELEMKAVLFEDRKNDMKAYLAQKIMDYGSMQNYIESEEGRKACPCNCKSAGYFLLIAEK